MIKKGNKNTRKVGIFIDCENTGSRSLENILDIASDYGDIIVRYAYANWALSKEISEIERWREKCEENGIITKYTPHIGHKKNSSDIKMVIDILKLVYENNILDTVIIVSSDSDFTAIVNEVKIKGIEVIGIGKKDITNKTYTNYFDAYFYLAEKPRDNKIGNKDEKVKNAKAKETVSNKKQGKVDNKKEKKKCIIPQNQFDQLIIIMENSMDNGRANQSMIVEKMKRIFNDFDRRNYEYKNYETFLGKILEGHNYKCELGEDKTTHYWIKK